DPDPDPDPLLRQDNDPVDPRNRPTRPDYPRQFLTDQDTASQWLEEHKHKSLFEIQLMVIDWIIEQESASPNDFTDRERKHMQVMRDKLVKSNKPLAPGNYHTDDYGYYR
ncbi:MAG: hypothetical protein ACKOGA_21795, partial [Planctomycetaceae bacterium]